MGLLKETMQAIIRIDRNLAAIRKVLVKDNDDRWYRAEYLQKPIEQVREDLQRKAESELPLFDRLSQLEKFPYPDNLTFGGRIKAVRRFRDLTQKEFGDSIGVTFGHISNLEKDITQPSAMLTRSISMIFNINERWLATGHLPQAPEVLVKPIITCKVIPQSGNKRKLTVAESIDRVRRNQLEVEHQMVDQQDPVLQRLREVDYRKETEQADPTHDERQGG